jgi:hypothetical protein
LENLPEMRGLLLLHKLPVWLGWPLFAAAVHDPRHRQKTARHVRGLLAREFRRQRIPRGRRHGADISTSDGSGTPPVVRRRGWAARTGTVRRAGLRGHRLDCPGHAVEHAFDHRVIDGAAAAEVLTEVKAALETGSEMNRAAPEHRRGCTGRAVTSVGRCVGHVARAVAGLET